MLNFNNTVSYGLRFLVNLAFDDKKPKQLKKIAKEEGISLGYLRKLIPLLEKAGMIKSVKGPGGGFTLKCKPSQIHLLDIMDTLSHSRTVGCLKGPSSCLRYNNCIVKNLWQEVYDKIKEVFKNKTLATVINNA